MAIDIRPFVPDDLARIADMRTEAFRHPLRPGPWLRGGGRVLTDNGEIVATTLVDPLGQFFGGSSVPVAAISGVMADPRQRGRGLGSRLLQAVLAEQRSLGVPLAVLYPSLVGVYRRVGFEFAGAHSRFRIPVLSVPTGGDSGLLEAWTDDDLREVNAGYRQAASSSAGQLDRSTEWWHERLLQQEDGQPLYRFLLRDADRVVGHIIYTQQSLGGYEFDVQVRDLSCRTLPAARSLLTLLAANQPMARDIVWTGPTDEPLLTLFDEFAPRAEWYFAWMLRVLDVSRALESRGYPPLLTMSVAFCVNDPILPENSGAYRLSIADGHGTAKRIATAGAALDAGALAALYSGWTRASSLAALDRLTGATQAEVALLDSAFGGPKPWMTEII